MFNLKTVMRFEILRTLKKQSFWLSILLPPIIIAIISGIMVFSNKASSDQLKQLASGSDRIVIIDQSGKVSKEAFQGEHAFAKATDKDSAISDVKHGRKDAVIFIPKQVGEQPVEVYAKDENIFNNNRYETMAQQLLKSSVNSKIDAADQQIIAGKLQTNSTFYRNGHQYDPIGSMIIPAAFLILLYIVLMTFVNPILTSTSEEKENRVTEMILTTIQPRTLIFGKILSIVILAAMQIIIMTLMTIVTYLVLDKTAGVPLDMVKHIQIEPVRIAMSALISTAGFAFFAGLVIAVGAAVPTAKEAGSFLGVLMTLFYVPLYFIMLIISTPDALLVRIISLVPLTSPMPLLIRNATGNLPLGEGLLAAGILIVSAGITFWIAIRLFHYGSIEYNKVLSLKAIFYKEKRS
jgi:ATP-dependent Na+ efflux pump